MFEIGQKVAHFKILRKLGEGGRHQRRIEKIHEAEGK